jgi:hypothetical protein
MPLSVLLPSVACLDADARIRFLQHLDVAQFCYAALAALSKYAAHFVRLSFFWSCWIFFGSAWCVCLPMLELDFAAFRLCSF